MPDWACRKCGVVNLVGTSECEACDAPAPSAAPVSPRRGMHIVRSTQLPTEQQPPTDTTKAQQVAASEVMRAVAAKVYDDAEGRRRLAVIFNDPSLEDYLE